MGSSAAMNVTPLRLAVLRFLAGKPGGYYVKGVVYECCPRPPYSNGSPGPLWSAQGAARMSGKLLKPLEAAGLVRTDPFEPTYSKRAYLTDAGRVLLAELDAAADRAALDQAIKSGA